MFQYVESLNRDNKEFVLVEIGDAIFLQFGRLDADSARLNESIIDNSYIGFYQGRRRIRDLLVVGDWDVNGIPVEEVPSELVLGETYTIKSSQARPGEPAEAAAIAEQGVIRFSTAEQINHNAEAQLSFDYRVIDAFYTGFEVDFYANANDYNTRRPIPLEDPKHPTGIRIEPATPFAAPGHYVHELFFTPTYVGYLRVLMRLVEGEETDRELYQLVDIDGNRLVDIDGNVLVGAASPNYHLTDIDGNRLVDIDGNVLIGFP